MGKKINKEKKKKQTETKNTKRHTRSKGEVIDLKEIENLKMNLLHQSKENGKKDKSKSKSKPKEENNKEKEKENQEEFLKYKELLKTKGKNKKKISKKIIINNNTKEVIPANRDINDNGGGPVVKKNFSKGKVSQEKKKEESGLTLMQLINNKQNLEEIQLVDGPINNNKSKKIGKKNEFPKKDINDNRITIKKEENEKNEFMKQIKPKIVMVNGKMTIEKPDVGLINKKYNEEHNNNLLPKETIFVNNEENINSLSFLNINHTKKWTKEDTDLFYRALELFGLDFSFLEVVLKPRKRVEIKRKYMKEKKENPKEIDRAINARKNMNKLNKILNVYKTENNLSLTKEDSFKKKNGGAKIEKTDLNNEYKKILNK